MRMKAKAVSAVLSGAMLLSSFLCLGMGMDMGDSWAPQEDHSCCPGGAAPEPQDSNCCLLLPAAATSAPTLPVPLVAAFVLTAVRSDSVLVAAPAATRVHSPPGYLSPGHAAPAAPRAPPVA